jgi:peptidoglycan hydrolase CwlO-like protein
MKKLVLLLVVAAVILLGVNYLRTGKIGFSSDVVSQAEQTLRDLEDKLAKVEAEITRAGRAAGLTGLDTTGDVAALVEEKERLEKAIAEARRKLK